MNDNVYTLLGIVSGSIAGIVIAYLKLSNTKNNELQLLRDEIKDLHNKIDRWRTNFELVFDQYERVFEHDPSQLSMLRDLRRVFEQ